MVESRYHLDTVKLIFVGPDCPSDKEETTRRILSSNNNNNNNGRSSKQYGQLQISTYCGEYTESFCKQHSLDTPDVVVFFNPGFTCPDYKWIQTLQQIKNGTPYLVTTNTELEGIADCQYLLDNDLITSVAPGIADALGISSNHSHTTTPYNYLSQEEETSFFDVNPFSGNRVRQSSTMANDLYVKNRWIFGGIFQKLGSQPANKKKKTTNTKSTNPALI